MQNVPGIGYPLRSAEEEEEERENYACPLTLLRAFASRLSQGPGPPTHKCTLQLLSKSPSRSSLSPIRPNFKCRAEWVPTDSATVPISRSQGGEGEERREVGLSSCRPGERVECLWPLWAGGGSQIE